MDDPKLTESERLWKLLDPEGYAKAQAHWDELRGLVPKALDPFQAFGVYSAHPFFEYPAGYASGDDQGHPED